MVKFDMPVGEGENKEGYIPEDYLVLSIDENGKIKYFNDKCEKIAGYLKDDVVDKRLLDILVPENYKDEWRRIFDRAVKNNEVEDFTLPWLNSEGEEIIASWSVAPLSESDKSNKNLGLVGKINLKKFDQFEKNQNIKQNNENSKTEDNKVLFNLGNKKIVFRKSKSSGNSEKNKEETKEDGISEKNLYTNAEAKHENHGFLDEYNHRNLVKNFEQLKQSVKSLNELKEKNQLLIKENEDLKKDLKSARDQLENLRKRLKKLEKNQFSPAGDLTGFFKNSLVFLFDIASGKRKKEEFNDIIKDLNERKNALKELEIQLNSDKKDINQHREDFVIWRKHLEALEDEIKKRKVALARREKSLKNSFLSAFDEDISGVKGDLDEGDPMSSRLDEKVDLDYHGILNKIPQGAAIVQRGILKQVNDAFTELIGYEETDILEKSFFDFILPEKLPDVEGYYFSRLKGDGVSSYDTVFLTKDGEKIDVEVSVKSTVFDGKKADIVVLREIDEKGSDQFTMGEKAGIDESSAESEISVPNDQS